MYLLVLIEAVNTFIFISELDHLNSASTFFVFTLCGRVYYNLT